MSVGLALKKDFHNLRSGHFFHDPKTELRINFKQTRTHLTRTSVKHITFEWERRAGRAAPAEMREADTSFGRQI